MSYCFVLALCRTVFLVTYFSIQITRRRLRQKQRCELFLLVIAANVLSDDAYCCVDELFQ